MRKFIAILITVVLIILLFKLFSVLLGTAWGFIGVILFIMFYPQLKKAFK
jgi:hypothetical protein